jgi:hypothetical protein
MKKTYLLISLMAFSSLFAFSQSRNARIFTIFTSGGCGCTGSGGPPKTFTTHEQVVSALQTACSGVDFLVWKDTRPAAFDEIQKNKANYDGMLIIGEMS